MSWQEHTKPAIAVGDKVCYSRQFLQSTAQHTGDAPFARGTVTALIPLGKETVLAEIEWDNPDLPNRVNTLNLSKVTEKGISERY